MTAPVAEQIDVDQLGVRERDSWGLVEGDPITAELTAVRLLGGGSAYEAYLAFDHLTYGPVVVKMLRPDQTGSSSALRSLTREDQALREINHPVVVRGLRASLTGDRPHLVLESIDGPRLSSLIRRHGPLQAQQYLPLAIDIASALHYLRRLDYLHLDIKPSNIIMGAPARLIDLSVARTGAQARGLDHLIGTDAYMAPEQCDPGGRFGDPGPASDIWGLGATLFEAIAGYRPFPGGQRNADRAEDRHPQITVEPAELPDRVPVQVRSSISSMLQRDPSDRPAPAEISDHLAPLLAALPRGHLAGFRVAR